MNKQTSNNATSKLPIRTAYTLAILGILITSPTHSASCRPGNFTQQGFNPCAQANTNGLTVTVGGNVVTSCYTLGWISTPNGNYCVAKFGTTYGIYDPNCCDADTDSYTARATTNNVNPLAMLKQCKTDVQQMKNIMSPWYAPFGGGSVLLPGTKVILLSHPKISPNNMYSGNYDYCYATGNFKSKGNYGKRLQWTPGHTATATVLP